MPCDVAGVLLRNHGGILASQRRALRHACMTSASSISGAATFASGDAIIPNRRDVLPPGPVIDAQDRAGQAEVKFRSPAQLPWASATSEKGRDTV